MNDATRPTTKLGLQQWLAGRREERQRKEAVNTISEFLGWLTGFKVTPSTRTPAEISAGVEQFFGHRPRPWRYHGSVSARQRSIARSRSHRRADK